jgi:hypothetical protein
MMASRGVEHSAAGVGAMLAGLAEVFVLDRADRDEATELAAMGYAVVEADTIVAGAARGAALAELVLSTSG